MTEQEFHDNRVPLYLDIDTFNIKLAKGKFANMSHAEWFNELNYPFVHTIRGYYMKTEDDEYIILYWNDFEVPNINVSLFSYIFSYFPTLKWLGLECHVGKSGEIWEPKYKIYKTSII